eukprot:3992440-Pleurochrysis_carterae.AAC.2
MPRVDATGNILAVCELLCALSTLPIVRNRASEPRDSEAACGGVGSQQKADISRAHMCAKGSL